MLEAALERRFTARVKAAGGLAFKLAPTVAGIPDRMVLGPGGRLWLVELKTETGKLSPIQELWHARAAELGHDVAVLYGREQVDAWVEVHLIG